MNKGSCYQPPSYSSTSGAQILFHGSRRLTLPSPPIFVPVGVHFVEIPLLSFQLRFVKGELWGRKPPALVPYAHGLESLLSPAVLRPALALWLSSQQSLSGFFAKGVCASEPWAFACREVCLPHV